MRLFRVLGAPEVSGEVVPIPIEVENEAQPLPTLGDPISVLLGAVRELTLGFGDAIGVDADRLDDLIDGVASQSGLTLEERVLSEAGAALQRLYEVLDELAALAEEHAGDVG